MPKQKPLTNEEQTILKELKELKNFISGEWCVKGIAHEHNISVQKLYGIARRSGEFKIEPMYNGDRHFASAYRHNG